MTEPTNMLSRINKNIDLDLAITMAGVFNTYNDAMARSKRTTYTPDDVIRILHIITHLIEATSEAPDHVPLPGRPIFDPTQSKGSSSL